MRGLRLGIGLTRVQSSGFTPSSLAPTIWYDPSDQSTLFQDTAGTTPVTAPGQSVARINDKSGGGYHLLQATAASRPTYQSDASGAYLLFDGVNDSMSVATPSIAQPFDRLSAFRQVAWTAAAFIYCGTGSATTGRLIQNGVSPQVSITENGGTNAVTANGPAVGASGVVTERHNVASSQVALNNGSYTTGSVGTGTPSGITIGSRGDIGSAYSNIRLYGLFQRSGTLSAADIAQLRTWLGAKVGLTL